MPTGYTQEHYSATNSPSTHPLPPPRGIDCGTTWPQAYKNGETLANKAHTGSWIKYLGSYMYPKNRLYRSKKCFIWNFPVQMLSKVPIFSGLNQGLDVAEGWGMFSKQNCRSCKNLLIPTVGGHPWKTKELLVVFNVKFVPSVKLKNYKHKYHRMIKLSELGKW